MDQEQVIVFAAKQIHIGCGSGDKFNFDSVISTIAIHNQVTTDTVQNNMVISFWKWIRQFEIRVGMNGREGVYGSILDRKRVHSGSQEDVQQFKSGIGDSTRL